MQSVFYSGTPYNLVSAPAAVVMGTTPLHLPRRHMQRGQKQRGGRRGIGTRATQAVQVIIPQGQGGQLKVIQAQAVISLAACTLAEPATVTLMLRRTNRTPMNIDASEVAVTIGAIGTSGQAEQDIPITLPRIPYRVTQNGRDIIQLWAWIDWGGAVGTSGQGTSGQEIPTSGVVQIRQASLMVE